MDIGQLGKVLFFVIVVFGGGVIVVGVAVGGVMFSSWNN